MKLINSLVYALLSMTTLAILASCQDEDFGYTTEEVRAGVYDRNFIKYYGEIPENQSWDLSSFGLIERLRVARENEGQTRGTGDYTGSWCNNSADGEGITLTYSKERAFTESHDLVQWIKKRLMEGDYRLNKGDGRTNKEEFNQRFSMIATEKSFQLMPIFQGIDNTIWDFHVVIEWLDDQNNKHTVDRVLWKKSDAMYMKGERPNLMGESIQDYVLDYHSLADLSSQTASVLAKGSDGNIQYAPNATDARKALNINPQGDVRFETTRLAADIQTQWVTVTGYPEQISTINFYLHVLQDNDDVNDAMTSSNGKRFWSDGREPENTSLTGNLVVLPVQVDILEYQDREIVLMGCETALSSKISGGKSFNQSDVYKSDGSGKSYKIDGSEEQTKHDYGDDDMNDIVFLLIGDETSKKLPELVNHNEVAKRYFFEDLGSVVDWDFNDVVLDMKQETYIESGKKMIKQTAILKHRCGTTPFDLFLKAEDGTYNKLNFDELIVNGHIPGVNEGDEMDRTQKLFIFGPKEYDENEETPWRPQANNVAIKVYPAGGPYADKTPDETPNDGVWSEYTGRYQESDGKHNIPRVFVADLSVWWTPENINFPNIWTRPQDAIVTKPEGAEPNDYSNGTIYGIGSDRSFRYPYLDNGEFILWNTTTRFDNWEPLWLSEGFIEGLKNGYNTIHIDFGNCTTEFCLLVRQDYRANDYKYGEQWKQFISGYSGKVYDFTIPTTNQTLYSGDQSIEGGSIQWYLNQVENRFSPSIGIQDNDEYDGHTYSGSDPGGFYITINKVWMTYEEPPVNHLTITWDEVYNFALSNSDWSKDCRMPAAEFNDVNVGDEIVVYIDNIQDGKTGKLCPMDDTWNAFNTNSTNYDWNGKTFSLYVNSSILDALKQYGMAIQGKGFTVKNVKLKKVKEINWNEAVNFALTDDSYFNYAKMDKSKFSDMQVGDVITVNISNVKSGAQGAFQSNWQNLVDAEDLSGKTSFSLTVTDDIKSKLQDNGLAIQGKGYTITSVTKTEPAKYQVTAQSADENKGTVSGSDQYAVGAKVNLIATPVSNHYVFTNWTKDATVVSTNATYQFTMTEAAAGTYTANFSEAPTYTISVATASECSEMGSASVNGNATGYTGDNVHIVATPASEEYVFDHWDDNNKSADRYVTIENSNQTYTAYFKVKPNETELWSGEATADGWTNQPTITLSKLTEESVGSTLHFYITPTENEWNLQIFSPDWGDGNMQCDYNQNNYNLNDYNGAVNIIVKSSMLTEKKFILNGDNVTCTRITIE